MKLSELFQIANELAPTSVSDEYCARFGAYDNSGVLVNTGEEIRGVVFSLDFSASALDEAEKTGANLIITHHPAIYAKISTIDSEAFAPIGEKLTRAIKNGISVMSMHLNLDCVSGGIDECLMQGICLASGENKVGKLENGKTDKTDKNDKNDKDNGAGTRPIAIMHPLDNEQSCGYGRVYDVEKTTLGGLVQGIEKVFSTKRIFFYGDEEKEIKRVASCCGGGGDEEAVEFACKNGADVLLSSDFKHHVLALAKEKGIAVIALTHYAAENYGFEKYYQKIRERVSVPCSYSTEKDLL